MKPSIWDILSAIFFVVGLVMASVFIIIYKNPGSKINPFPPPTQTGVVVVSTITTTPISLPDVWTPLPDAEDPEIFDPSDIDGTAGIGPRTEITNTPVVVLTYQPDLVEETGPTPFPQPKSATGLQKTWIPPELIEPTFEYDSENRPLTITAPIGVFNNVWQNIQAIPSFSWSTTLSAQTIDHFLLYFGPRQNGQLTTKTQKTHYNSSAVSSGIYYFRVLAIATDGTTIGVPSYFLFKYDDTRPTEPGQFMTTSTGDTDIPYFTWTESMDAHSGMTGGMGGYSIYQGTTKRCGKPVAFTSDTHWTPVDPVAKGTTMYFCIRAMDAIGNESDWVGPISYTYSQ